MPKIAGVYRDGRGGWYFKAAVHKDPLTGKWRQVTRRGFASATEAGEARKAFLDAVEPAPAPSRMLTIDELLDQYLDDAEATGRLSVKTLFDYRTSADHYVRPWLGKVLVHELDAQTIVAWQRHLAESGARRSEGGLSPNTIRLARAPLGGAMKYAVLSGMLATNPLASVPPPRPRRSIPKHWSPEQAREFLALQEGDRLWPLWAFLLGSGLRIGELVALRWPNVDLDAGLVRINEFVTVLGHDVVPSDGKSTDAVRTVDVDEQLERVLRLQRKQQREEQLAAETYEESEYVFTKRAGGPYHPQRLSRVLGKISEESGLPRLTAHGLRHTSATLMLAQGVPPKVAAERLGHADATLFSNLYSHVTPTMQREAAKQIGAALFRDGR